VTWKILFAIIMGKIRYFKHRKYQSVWMNRPNKVIEAIKNIFFKMQFLTSAENLNF